MSRNSRGVSHNDAISELEVGVDITWDANLLLQLLVLSAVNDIGLNERASQISSDLHLSRLHVTGTVSEQSHASLRSCTSLSRQPLLRHLLDFADGHEVIDVSSRDLSTCSLKRLHEILHNLDEGHFDLTGQEFTRAISHADILELLIVLKEEFQILIGHIDAHIATIGTMLLNCLTATSFGVLVDLGLDLVGLVRNEDRAAANTTTHFGLLALQRGEKG